MKVPPLKVAATVSVTFIYGYTSWYFVFDRRGYVCLNMPNMSRNKVVILIFQYMTLKLDIQMVNNHNQQNICWNLISSPSEIRLKSGCSDIKNRNTLSDYQIFLNFNILWTTWVYGFIFSKVVGLHERKKCYFIGRNFCW